MKRRSFIKNSVLGGGAFFVARDLYSETKGPMYGHNEMKFKLNTKWGALNSAKTPVNDCHEMIEDSRGRLILLTNEIKNNIIIYNKILNKSVRLFVSVKSVHGALPLTTTMLAV